MKSIELYRKLGEIKLELEIWQLETDSALAHQFYGQLINECNKMQQRLLMGH